MGRHHCSADDAWRTIVSGVKSSGVGPGAVSRALLNIVTGIEENGFESATIYWRSVLSGDAPLPAEPTAVTAARNIGGV